MKGSENKWKNKREITRTPIQTKKKKKNWLILSLKVKKSNKPIREKVLLIASSIVKTIWTVSKLPKENS